jgi:hypothetical protein
MLYVAWARAQIPTIPAEHPAAAGPAVQDYLCVCTGMRETVLKACARRSGGVGRGGGDVTQCDSRHCKCFVVRLICMHYLCTAGIYVKKP